MSETLFMTIYEVHGVVFIGAHGGGLSADLQPPPACISHQARRISVMEGAVLILFSSRNSNGSPGLKVVDPRRSE